MTKNCDSDFIIEKLDSCGYVLKQKKGIYHFTSDSVLLAKFASVKHGDNVLEIGCGSGIISLIIFGEQHPKHITLIDIQKQAADLARENVALNNLEGSLDVVCGDVKDFSLNGEKQFDVIVCNPPYKKSGTAFVNLSETEKLSRHEIALDAENLCRAANKLLKFGGKFYLMYDSDRIAEIIYKLKSFSLEPKRMQFSYPNLNKDAGIVFIECVKGGKEGIKVLPPLIRN